MVLMATRLASTFCSPLQHRPIARTILLTSTSSKAPLRFFTCIWVNASAGTLAAGRPDSVFASSLGPYSALAPPTDVGRGALTPFEV